MRPLGNDISLGTMANGQSLLFTREQRGRHTYVAGATGTGKSKCLEHMIRQDILNWPYSRCGLMVFDKHGPLFDSIMQWIAAKGLRHVPIVPVDLRRNDWVTSYNPLRRRPRGNAAVIASGFSDAIIHAWGQENMNETPRLAKMLPAVLGTLYEREYSLVDALHLFSSAELRRAMTAGVKNFVSRTVWNWAQNITPREFNEEITSTFNRLLRFLGNETTRAMLAQTAGSLDLGAAMEEGSIILVCLATAGSQVDSQTARTIGSMLLSDLWTAALNRGKRDEGAGGVKPFYLYIDEFQDYLTPIMAETIDQARGFGVHMALAQQFPSQLTGRGELGQLIFDSVMANARSKIVFQLDHPKDLETMALWLGRQQIDLDEIKHQHYGTKVLDYTLKYLTSYGSSTTEGEAESWQDTHTDGTLSVTTNQWGHTDAVGGGGGRNSGRTQSDVDDEESQVSATEGTHEEASEQHSDTYGGSEASGTTASDGHAVGGSRSRTRTTSETSSPMQFAVMGKEASPPQFRSVEEQLFRLTQLVAGQPQRHAVARLADTNVVVPMVVPIVKSGATTQRYIAQRTMVILANLPCAVPMAEATKCLEHHEATFVDSVLAPGRAGEPAVFKRKIIAKLLPPPAIPPDQTPPQAA